MESSGKKYIVFQVSELVLFQHICFPLLYYNRLRVTSSGPGTVFMSTNHGEFDVSSLCICLEGFLYGKIFVLCALTYLCTLNPIIPGLGVYSGIFAIYLQHPAKDSRTAIIIFYVLCLLYVLSTVTVVNDIINTALRVSNNSICKNIIF